MLSCESGYWRLFHRVCLSISCKSKGECRCVTEMHSQGLLGVDFAVRTRVRQEEASTHLCLILTLLGNQKENWKLVMAYSPLSYQPPSAAILSFPPQKNQEYFYWADNLSHSGDTCLQPGDRAASLSCAHQQGCHLTPTDLQLFIQGSLLERLSLTRADLIQSPIRHQVSSHHSPCLCTFLWETPFVRAISHCYILHQDLQGLQLI